MRTFRRAIAVQPEDPRAYFRMGNALFALQVGLPDCTAPLVHFRGKRRPPSCCWQACLAVAFTIESCSPILAPKVVTGAPSEWLCVATRGACLAPASCKATCSSSWRQVARASEQVLQRSPEAQHAFLR